MEEIEAVRNSDSLYWYCILRTSVREKSPKFPLCAAMAFAIPIPIPIEAPVFWMMDQ